MQHRFHINRAAPVVCLLFVTSLSPGQATSAPEAALDVDLGPVLTKRLTDIRSLEATQSPDRHATLEARLGDLKFRLSDIRVFSAVATEEDGTTQDLMMAVMSVGRDDAEGKVAMGVSADGVVRQLEIWGSDDFDRDTDGVWSYFCSQFVSKSRVIDPATTLGSFDIEQLVDQWAEGDGEEPARTLHQQRQIMRENSYRFTYLGEARKSGDLPEASWYQQWASEMQTLIESSSHLEEVVGSDNVEVYVAAAETGRDILTRAAVARADDDQAAVRSIMGGLYRQSCQVCHKLEAPSLGPGTIYWEIRNNFDRFGVRSDLMQAGLDTWSVASDPERSQQTANAIRAALMVLHGYVDSD